MQPKKLQFIDLTFRHSCLEPSSGVNQSSIKPCVIEESCQTKVKQENFQQLDIFCFSLTAHKMLTDFNAALGLVHIIGQKKDKKLMTSPYIPTL